MLTVVAATAIAGAAQLAIKRTSRVAAAAAAAVGEYSIIELHICVATAKGCESF